MHAPARENYVKDTTEEEDLWFYQCYAMRHSVGVLMLTLIKLPAASAISQGTVNGTSLLLGPRDHRGIVLQLTFDRVV